MMPIASPEMLTHAIKPLVRGALQTNAPLTKLTWFRTGGPADLLFEPADTEDLVTFLRAIGPDLPVTVLGLGSNTLVRDGGIEGVVIRLGKAFGAINVAGTSLSVGAGAAGITVARRACDAGLSGFEFLRGIPGTIGGVVAMNAGAYGQETSDILAEVHGLTRTGHAITLTNQEIGFSYRSAPGVKNLILTHARFTGKRDSKGAIQARMDKIAADREESQPLRTRTGGSTFKNPPGQKAWQLIDQAGARGQWQGDAQISPKHCNFLINHGRASAADLEALGEAVRAKVKAHSGVDLLWEIHRIGRGRQPNKPGEDA